MKCSDHESTKKWTSENENCSNCILFKPAVPPNGRLPTLKSVIEYFYHLRSVDSYPVEYNVTLDLINHWVKYNVYTLIRKTVQSRLTTHLEKLKYLKNYIQALLFTAVFPKRFRFFIVCLAHYL